jgi:TatA/E family protein of Tat protein translocase
MGVTFAFLSPQTVIIVVVVALLVFGPHKMPELMRQLGQALREFKKMTGDVQNAFNIDDQLSYDRYDPPSYHYNNYSSATSYETLDQYQPEEDPYQVKALPAADVTAGTEVAETTEKPRRKRAPRKKKVETEVAEATATAQTVHETPPAPTGEDKELEK